MRIAKATLMTRWVWSTLTVFASWCWIPALGAGRVNSARRFFTSSSSANQFRAAFFAWSAGPYAAGHFAWACVTS